MGLPVRTAAPARPPVNHPWPFLGSPSWQSQTGRVWVRFPFSRCSNFSAHTRPPRTSEGGGRGLVGGAGAEPARAWLRWPSRCGHEHVLSVGESVYLYNGPPWLRTDYSSFVEFSRDPRESRPGNSPGIHWTATPPAFQLIEVEESRSLGRGPALPGQAIDKRPKRPDPRKRRTSALIYSPDTTQGTAIYAYIDPQNHPNVGIYMAYMECLGSASAQLRLLP